MKKPAWIALAVLAVLAGIFFVIRDEPSTTVRAPMTIAAIDELERVELVPPDSAEGGELIVLEQRDGDWKMTRPVESELSRAATNKLSGLFAEEIRTDDLALSADKKEEYGLDDTSAVTLSAYAEGSDNASIELEIGREIIIEQTGARRTYVKKPGEETVYRAQAALGDFVRRSADDLRSKSIVDLDREAISELNITPEDGETVGLVRQDEEGETTWTMPQPQVDGELDQNKVSRLVNAVSRLRAAGFADDAQPGEVGLEPARVSVELATVDDTSHVLSLGDGTDDGTFYARFDDGDIFTVGKSVADRLSPTADELLEQEDTETAETTQ